MGAYRVLVLPACLVTDGVTCCGHIFLTHCFEGNPIEKKMLQKCRFPTDNFFYRTGTLVAGCTRCSYEMENVANALSHDEIFEFIRGCNLIPKHIGYSYPWHRNRGVQRILTSIQPNCVE